jgi:hypothetical protein
MAGRSAVIGSGRRQRPAAQQATVLGEQHPAVGVRPLDKGIIIGVIDIGGVHAGQPQPAGHRAQVHIENKTRRRQLLRPPHGLDPHHIPVARPVPGRGRLAVDQQAAGFGQRHPQRLHHVTQRRGTVHGHGHRAAAAARPQEQPQLSRDDHDRLRLVHLPGMPQLRRTLTMTA